jgi:hypothetical protein
VAATVPSFLSISGSPITTSGTLAISYSGTALPTTSGGTGLTSFTANGVVYASSSSALATGSALTFDGTNFATTGTASATKLIPTGNVTAGNGMYLPTTNTLAWSTNGAEGMRITSAGDLLAAKTSPGQVLTAGFEYNNTNNNQYLSICNNGGGNAAFYIANKASGSTTLANFYSGSTLVGNITSNGTITVYGTTSDYRLKTVVGAVSGSGERIDALQPVEYAWNSDGSRTRGFLAHQFQEVYANSVTGAKDEIDADGKPVYQAMQASTSEVIADLVAEIQSLRKRLTALEQK